MTPHLTFLFVLILQSQFLGANDLQQGIDAYRRKDYEAAMKILLPLAESGNVEAQVRVGDMYHAGFGVTRSVPAYLKWYEAAATQGDVFAMANLGMFYATDRHVYDPAKAQHWLERAANAGDAQSMGLLAVQMLSHRNDVDGYGRWMEKAAEAGYEDAAVILADAYMQGKPLARDYSKGLYWSGKLAEKNNPKGHTWLGVIYSQALGVSTDFARARAHFEKAAISGDAIAQYRLGEMYYKGNGVEKDFDTAIRWLNQAARKGNYSAMLIIAYAYINGWGVPRDYFRAYVLMRCLSTKVQDKPLMDDIEKVKAALGPDRTKQADQLCEEIFRGHASVETMLPPFSNP